MDGRDTAQPERNRGPAAAIDVGSNSVKLLVGEWVGGTIRILREERMGTRLSRALAESSRIQEAAGERTVEATAGLVQEALRAGTEKVFLVGTHSFRAAANPDHWLRRFEEATGLPLTVLSPGLEAELSLRAVVNELGLGEVEVVGCEVGGGSTQVTRATGGKVVETVSLPTGCVGLTERFLRHDPPRREEMERIRDFVQRELSAGVDFAGVDGEVVALGGTAVCGAQAALGLRRFDRDAISGVRISREQFEKLLLDLVAVPRQTREEDYAIEPERSDVILAGLTVLLGIMRRLSVREVLIGTWGLRHGLLINHFEGSTLPRVSADPGVVEG